MVWASGPDGEGCSLPRDADFPAGGSNGTGLLPHQVPEYSVHGKMGYKVFGGKEPFCRETASCVL